jgi:hypothetical protein
MEKRCISPGGPTSPCHTPQKNDPALLVLGHCRDYIRRGSHGTETQGEEAQSLFVEGDSVVSLTLYSSLVLLALCAAVIATDLTTPFMAQDYTMPNRDAASPNRA